MRTMRDGRESVQCQPKVSSSKSLEPGVVKLSGLGAVSFVKFMPIRLVQRRVSDKVRPDAQPRRG